MYKPNGTLKNIGVFMLCVLVVGIMLANEPARRPIFVLGGLLGAAVSTLFHELGHLLAGWLVGWRLIVFNIWGLSLHWPNRRISLGQPEVMKDTGGWVMMLPKDEKHFTTMRTIVFCAGGPAASLLQILAGLWLLFANPQVGVSEPFASDTLGFGLTVFGAITFLATGIPALGERKNDANEIAVLFRAWRDGGPLNSHFWIIDLLRFKLRLRDLPEWLIENAVQRHAEDDKMVRFLASLEISRILDQREVDAQRAMNLMADFEQQFGSSDWLICCRAYCQAVHQGDWEEARTTMHCAGLPSELPQMDYAAKAAIAMLEGDRKTAGELLDLMDAEIAAGSPLKDMTFHDIRKQVEKLKPITAAAERASPSDLSRGSAAT